MLIFINQIIFVALCLAAFLFTADYIRKKEDEQIKREDAQMLNSLAPNTFAEKNAGCNGVPMAAFSANETAGEKLRNVA